MYLAKCTFTVIIFAIILNINANGIPLSSNSTVAPTTLSSAVPTDITIPTVASSLTDEPTTTVTPVTSTSIPTSISTTSASTTSTTVSTTSKVTTSSPNTTEAPHHNRQFDGPSFIGGIVLATGLMAIGFVAFKFYKARTERNYHTL